MLEHSMVEGFIYPEHLKLLIKTEGIDEMLHELRLYSPPSTLSRWIDRE
jgi:hypothetical protein